MERKLLFWSQLEIIPDIGKTERYTLVGCSISVVNPFVRYDLIQDFFCQDDSTANHFEPQRFFLIRDQIHYSEFGPFVMC